MAAIFAVMAFFYKPVSKRKDHDDESVALVKKDDSYSDEDEDLGAYPDSSDL